MAQESPVPASPWAPRIYSPKGFVKEDILNGSRTLDVGCGSKKLPGATGIDMLALPGVDIVHNLESFPWPIADNSYDLVFANHFLEHVSDVPRTIGEMHRILSPRGRVVIQVPYFRSTDAFGDPTHQRFFTARSLDYFIQDAGRFERFSYTPFSFSRIGFWYAWPHESKNPITKMFKRWIASHPDTYDQYVSLLIPLECLTWELEAIK
jgi:SAM-dependent methyltransferase